MSEFQSNDAIQIPPQEPCEGAVIWLHGLGANGGDFVPIVPQLRLPNIRFIFPHAPERPVTINRGWVMRAWYDILTLEESTNRESFDDVQASHQLITQLIDAQIEQGLSPNQIVLAGFSQGGAMALHTGLRYPASLGGIMALSCYLVAPEKIARESHPENSATPILMCHGSHDSVVPVSRGRAAHTLLSEQNEDRDIQWNDFPMDHEVCAQEIEVIQRWLHERFGIFDS